MQRAEGSNKKEILSKKILGAVLTAVLVLGSVVLPQFSVMVRADESVSVMKKEY